MKITSWTTLFCVTVLTVTASGCNVFDPLDSPNTDAQILSAARAALDRKDFGEARSLYSKLSNSKVEIRESELAFTELNEQGLTMETFAAAFGSGGSGTAINRLAESMVSTAGAAKRDNLYRAYTRIARINTTELKGIVRFITSAALAAEILAEQAAVASVTSRLDVVDITTSFSCKTLTTTCNDAACDAAAGANFTNLGATFDFVANPTSLDLSPTVPDLAMLLGLFGAMDQALRVELGAGGDFTSTLSFASQFTGLALGVAAGQRCLRHFLVSAGVGA